MPDPAITTIAGCGVDRSTFHGPAARLDLRQPTPGTTELGRLHGVAVGPRGDVYVSSAGTVAVGRIEPPSRWRALELADGLTTPTGDLLWATYPTTVAASFDATSRAGRSAVHWVATNADSRTCLYVKFPAIVGATGHASILVSGSGQVCLELYDSGGDVFGPTVTLSDTPQVLTLDKLVSDPTMQLQLRSRSAQAHVEVLASDASFTMTQLTGGTAPVADRHHLRSPAGIAVDRRGRVVIADTYGSRILAVSPSASVTTIAGTGVAGWDGDGTATRHRVDHPGGVAVDRSGVVYIADTYNNRVRRIDRSGRISTVAGTGEPGYGGDGLRATAARLHHPQGVAVGADGSVYVADTYNNRIRRIDRRARITTVAGTGEPGFAGDGGPASTAQLSTPHAVTVPADGALFVADTLNQRVRRIAGGVIGTVVGTGRFGAAGRVGGAPAAAQLSEPLGVAVDAVSGDLYVVESTQAVLRVTGL